MEELDISNNDGVFLAFKNKERITWYKVSGDAKVKIDPDKVALEFNAQAKTQFQGFTVAQPFTQDPFIGGFKSEEHTQGGMLRTTASALSVLPCTSQFGEVLLCDPSISTQKENTVEFQLLLFSLTYVERFKTANTLAKCEYTITDSAGKEWVRMTQHTGALSGDLGGSCGNNHPRRADIHDLNGPDCCVYLPKETYVVRMTNTGPVNIQAWVHHPHIDTAIDGDNQRNIYKGTLSPGATVEITIPASEFTQAFHRNSIKINGNAVYEVNP